MLINYIMDKYNYINKNSSLGITYWKMSIVVNIVNRVSLVFDHFRSNNKEHTYIPINIGNWQLGNIHQILGRNGRVISSDQTSKKECQGKGSGEDVDGDLIYANISYSFGYMSVLYSFSDFVCMCICMRAVKGM